jgi:hypothetical protein
MNMLDNLARAWYGDKIELALRKSNEQAYEDLFIQIMQATYGEDFVPVKAAGSDGDWKSDGYLASDKHVFQSYAPSTGFRKAILLKKIDDDLPGAIGKWKDKMENWTFVHNSWEGLPPYAINQIEDYKSQYPKLLINLLGPEILKDNALRLPNEKLVDLFGPAPTMQDMHALSHAPIKTLLNAIKSHAATPATVITPVSVDKLEYNQLSGDIEILLRAGRTKEKLVDELLSTWPDPQYGEDLAESFRNRYAILKDAGLSANDIFDKLKAFSGGNSYNTEEQISALAVLSYFFSRCDVFENVPNGSVA